MCPLIQIMLIYLLSISVVFLEYLFELLLSFRSLNGDYYSDPFSLIS